MGSPTDEVGRTNDENQTQVMLTKGFYLGKYEVTQTQYEAVMTGNTNSLSPTPSNWPNNPDRPVEQVSWDDAQNSLLASACWLELCSAHRGPMGICLPGGTTSGGMINSSYANYNWDGDVNTGNDFKQTRDVGKSQPVGLF